MTSGSSTTTSIADISCCSRQVFTLQTTTALADRLIPTEVDIVDVATYHWHCRQQGLQKLQTNAYVAHKGPQDRNIYATDAASNLSQQERKGE